MDLVIGDVADRQPRLENNALQTALRRIEDVVAGVTRPAGRGDVGVRRRAELVDEILVDRRTVGKQRDLRLLEPPAVVDRVGFRDRNTEAHRSAERARAVLRNRETGGIERFLVGLGRARNAVDGPVGLEIRRRIGAVVAARVHGDGEGVAGPEDVLLRNRRRQHDAFRARIADARQ